MKMSGKLVAILSVVVCATAFGQIAWDNPNGTASSFSWANGQNMTNNFGSPTISSDWMFFLESNFDAAASEGSTDTKTDQMDVDLYALPSLLIEKIELYAYGDYSISDPTTSGLNSVTGNFDMSSGALSDSINFFEDEQSQGNWYEVAEIYPNATSLHLTVIGNVIAVSDGLGGAASITANQNIKIRVIPEPATLALISLCGLVLIRRR